eukprot:s3297_g10.t1
MAVPHALFPRTAVRANRGARERPCLHLSLLVRCQLLLTMASRDPDSPSTADLEYAAAIAERQYRQWREHERLHQSDAALPKARGRSRSPAPGRVASSLVETTPNSRGEGTSSECSDVRHQPHLSMTHCDPCGAPPLAQRGETVVRLLTGEALASPRATPASRTPATTLRAVTASKSCFGRAEATMKQILQMSGKLQIPQMCRLYRMLDSIGT